MSTYHVPVLLQQCVDGLNIKKDGTYVDVTFGGGGHSREILKHLESGMLYGFDQDEDASANIPESKNFKLVQANFRFLKDYLRLEGVQKIDGLLADLGISSWQIDAAERGFSTRFEGGLDMRMDQLTGKTAKDVINTYSVNALQEMFSNYGEVRNAKSLAEAIVQARHRSRITTTDELKSICHQLSRGNPQRYCSQVFQAIRIEVNDEMEALKEMLSQAGEMLDEGGRLVVMSYHSLEDRLVKRYMKWNAFDEPAAGSENLFKQVTKKPIMADEAECKENPRARSAKLRIVEKL